MIPKTLAIIDDETHMKELYEFMFEDEIFQRKILIHYFTDPLNFLIWLPDHQPDLMIVDMSLPHLNGIELLKKMKSMGHTIPTYLVSGHDKDYFEGKIEQLSVTHIFEKPFRMFNLKEMISTELELGDDLFADSSRVEFLA